MANRSYHVFSTSPENKQHQSLAFSLDLRVLLNLLKDGWQQKFKEKFGREFDLEKDLIDQVTGEKVIYNWINQIGFDEAKFFPTVKNKWQSYEVLPIWVSQSPSYLILASELLKKGRSLSEMKWQQFEKLIGELLEKEGWEIELTKGSKDGGVDVIAKKADKILGDIKTIWQTKKYGPGNLVRLSHVRELSAVRESFNATKGIIVTTSRLTRDAIEWIKRDAYKLSFKDNQKLIEWVLKCRD